ncbi:mechanosensitive ion channel family protein [Niabella sp. CC-SYL272]|uniref:mechanosensitive ion channel family protein n=1 Tax=Niabella agricola TaxID=2891571 RepID=UPI001F385082|nr:mechanosensitive ion channel family protein [Niabella agricola]MCF3107346.1 mechanosensitive ion channel family protein [Niabella agricola]
MLNKYTSGLDKWMENLIPWLISSGLRILAIIIATIVVYFILLRVINRIVKVAVKAGQDHDIAGEIQREKTLSQIFRITLKIISVLIAGLMIASEFGIKIAPLIASAGVIGLAFGFGGQYLIKDLISGLFIIMENQYRIGDFITIADLSGTVERISLRVTTLRDMDGNVHHVPHGEVKTVSNGSKAFARVNLDIGVGYGSDIDQVKTIVDNVGNELATDASWKDHIISPPQFLRVQDLADSSVVIKVWGDTKPGKQWAVSGELRKRIYDAFNNNGIEIPFPQRVVHIKKS